MTTVVITVGGVDVTEDVVFESARFESKVNGQAGEAYMRVRDLDSTYSFTEGADWLVTINGAAAWRGYVTQKISTYIYDAGNVAESGLQRFFDLRGADLNLLFSQRIVFDTASPTTVAGTQFAASTNDSTAIADLVANWLDLSSDDLDTSSGVETVGVLDPAQKTRAWSGGWQWGQAMTSIAALPAAVYYIRPETGSPRGTLVYCDVDVPDAPFGLSDVPNGTTLRGYREAEITLDGTSLANDVLCWGMSYGNTKPVFRRVISGSSRSLHGTWQTSRVVPGVYKQATINRIADSIVNGSKTSRRGAINDRSVVRLVTYEPGLLAGHKLTFASEVWGWTDVIPVRQLVITFESPTAPRYELLLSHEIDTPWSYIDSYWPDIPSPPPPPLPPFPPPPLPPVPDLYRETLAFYNWTRQGAPWGSNFNDRFTNLITEYVFHVPKTAGGTQVDFDLFNRTESGDWGYSTDGHLWTPKGNLFYPDAVSGGGGTLNVAGGYGVMDTDPPGYQNYMSVYTDTNPAGAWSNPSWDLDWSWGSYWDASSDPNNRRYALCLGIYDTAGDWVWSVLIEWDGYGNGTITINDPNSGSSSTPTVINNDGVLNVGHVEYRDDGSGRPVWTVCANGDCVSGGGDGWWGIGLDCSNECGGVFDTFNRVVATGWGAVSSMGTEWVAGTIYTVLSTSYGVATMSTTDEAANISAIASLPMFGPWSGPFVMTTTAQFSTVPSSANYRFTANLTDSDVASLILLPRTDGLQGVTLAINASTAHSAMTFAQGTWYNVEWTWGGLSSGSMSAKVWAVGDAKPSSPTVSISGPTTGSPGSYFSVSKNTLNAHDTDAWQIGEIAITDPRCAQANFDAFGRTVASGWGSADPSGYQWTVGSGVWSVSPGQGIVTQTTSGREATVGPNINGPWTLPEVTLTIVFTIANAPTTTSDTSWLYTSHSMQSLVQMAITDGPPITGTPKSYIQCAGETTFIPHGFWVGGGEYTMVVERAHNERRASISSGGTTYSTNWGPEGGATDTFGLSPNINSGTQTFTFSSIDFSYPGSPCYYECDPSVDILTTFDNFSGRTTTTNDPDSWGTAVPGGVAWAISNSSGSPITGAQKAWVAGDVGFFDESYTVAATPTVRAKILGGFPIGSSDWTMDMRFKFTNDLPAGGGSALNLLRQTLSMTATGPVSPTTKFTRTIGEMRSDGAGTCLFDTWYRFKFEYSHTNTWRREKLWIDGTTEPAWSSPVSIGIDMKTSAFFLQFQAFRGSTAPTPATTGQVVIDNIGYITHCAPVEPSVTTPPTGANGYGCEDAVRLDATHYKVSQPFIPDSTNVTRDGIAQRRGTDYTEGSDHQTLTFSDAVASTSSVVVCYFPEGQA